MFVRRKLRSAAIFVHLLPSPNKELEERVESEEGAGSKEGAGSETQVEAEEGLSQVRGVVRRGGGARSSGKQRRMKHRRAKSSQRVCKSADVRTCSCSSDDPGGRPAAEAGFPGFITAA